MNPVLVRLLEVEYTQTGFTYFKKSISCCLNNANGKSINYPII